MKHVVGAVAQTVGKAAESAAAGIKGEVKDQMSYVTVSRFVALPKAPSRTKFTTDSKFTIRSIFATAIVKHYGGHFETTMP